MPSDASIDEFVRPGHCDQIIQIERRRVGSSRCGALVVPTPIKGVMFSEHHSLLYR